MNDTYEMTIGIECHVQLATKTKLFSGADNDARDKDPNTAVNPVDFGLPGMLPVLNRDAVNLAIRAGKALNAEVARVSRFDRKHYFYPDLPKGYQTTQMYHPIILEGYVDAPLEDGSSVHVRVHHAHMEEDAGKLTHYSDYSLVDLNRAGTPLIEIVSEPDIHSAAEAKAYALELYRLMTYAGVTHGDLYHGNMRFDVNISVAKKGATELGKRAEIKNLNSFKSVERAAEYEFKRQVALLEKGETVTQETRGWDDAKQRTFSQRSKENAQDYRYMPDADIPPIILSDDEIARVQSAVPKLPGEWRTELAGLGITKLQVEELLDAEYAYSTTPSILQTVYSYLPDHKKALFVAQWIINQVLPIIEQDMTGVDLKPWLIDALYDLQQSNKVSSTNAKKLFSELFDQPHCDVEAYATTKGYMQESNEDAIAAIVDEVLADPASAQSVADIQAGKDKAIGYLVGQIMKRSAGKANPGLATQLIRTRLGL